MNSKISSLIRISIKKILPTIGIIILLYLIINIGIEKIISALYEVQPIYLLLAFSLLIPRVLFDTYKWQFICRKQKMNFTFFYLMKINLISSFYSKITPGGLGGYIKIYYIKDKGKLSIEKCISNILMDATVETITLYFFAIIGAIMLIKEFSFLLLPISAAFIIYLFLFLLFMKKEKSKVLFSIFVKYIIPKRFKEKMSKSFEHLYEDLPNLKDMIIPFLIAGVTWILNFSQMYIVSIAFSIDVPYFDFITICALSIIIASIPVTIGGFGLREGSFILMLSIYGISPEKALLMSIIGSLIKNESPAIIGAIISLTKTND